MTLFNSTTGFEVEGTQELGSCRIVPTEGKHLAKFITRVPAYMYVQLFARKVSEPKLGLSWDVKVDEIAAGTIYPSPTEKPVSV